MKGLTVESKVINEEREGIRGLWAVLSSSQTRK